jgi:hypothetical protein
MRVNYFLNNVDPEELIDFLKYRGWALVEEGVKDGLYILKNDMCKHRQLTFPVDIN